MSRAYDLEFSTTLADGREAHVLAKVYSASDIRLESVTVGPVGDDAPLPLERLTAADRKGLDDDASSALYDEQERAKESA